MTLTDMRAEHGDTPRIGPNAIIRVAEVLRESFGETGLARVLLGAGLAGYLHEPPADLVDERKVTRLHRELRAQLG